MNFDYDLFVIGGGSGGVRAARIAAQEAQAKVAIAEMSRYGGTCVIRGCVPKKLMVFASSFSRVSNEADAYGWDFAARGFNWAHFSDKLGSELDRLESVYCSFLQNAGVQSFNERATIIDPHTVELDSGKRFTASYILVATGGHPQRPDIPNADLALVSDDLFKLNCLPKTILIVGGGYIACEFAGILNGLGVRVTQFYRGSQILRGFDLEARELIADQMKGAGVELHLETNVKSLEPKTISENLSDQTAIPLPPTPFKVMTTSGDELEFEAVLFATGRSPNTARMGLEKAGVERGQRGEIKVDAFSQTNIPSIFAIGDVTNRVNLTPVAIREAMAFVETVFKSNPTAVDHQLIPSAVFTQPELGTIGLSEEVAQQQEKIEVYATSFAPMRSAFADQPDRAMMKLVVSQSTRKVLGCTIVGPAAAEIIQLAGVAIKMGATKEDFDRTVAVHPTMAEEMVTMRFPTRIA
ncbi:MAG: glutathione-disulfide reductase [Aestuariivita sp.]|nr:glutathione-disulfide reductase [Aestuariivita sp.]MCY4202830.1 glutathione-disulfide reductase [Aestuariivita sp.]